MAHWESTPSHGYLVLTPAERDQLSAFVCVHGRANGREYEEDCAWALPIVELPYLANQAKVRGDHTPAEFVALAHKTAKAWSPDVYEIITGHKVTAEESPIIADREFHAANKGRLMVISAIGVDRSMPGMVACVASVDGERSWNDEDGQSCWLVTAERYRARGVFSHLIDPSVDHQIDRETLDFLWGKAK